MPCRSRAWCASISSRPESPRLIQFHTLDWRLLLWRAANPFLLEVVLMSLIVQKFGGSSVRDHEHLLRMARIVKGNVDRGDEVLVVLSAQGDTTDGLLQRQRR